jgi:hypothetical protein
VHNEDVEFLIDYDAMNEQIEDGFQQELSIASTFGDAEEEDGCYLIVWEPCYWIPKGLDKIL